MAVNASHAPFDAATNTAVIPGASEAREPESSTAKIFRLGWIPGPALRAVPE
jgi:hypothetical protein